MKQSQRDAITAALLELGYPTTSQDVIVTDVTRGTPAASVLRPGDVVLAVDGERVHDADKLRELIGARDVGDPVDLTIRRSGDSRDVSVRTIDSGDASHRPIVGFTPDLRATFGDVRVQIGLDPAEVGGPSAGLAFSLGIIDKLTPGSLTGGRTVAGTGTIDAFGHVGPIGGIQQKIVAAERAGATVFLAPAGDCADALSVVSDSMTLVKVDTLRTALDALQAIRAGSSDFPRC